MACSFERCPRTALSWNGVQIDEQTAAMGDKILDVINAIQVMRLPCEEQYYSTPDFVN